MNVPPRSIDMVIFSDPIFLAPIGIVLYMDDIITVQGNKDKKMKKKKRKAWSEKKIVDLKKFEKKKNEGNR